MSLTVEQMAEMGKAVLHDQGITDMSDIRYRRVVGALPL